MVYKVDIPLAESAPAPAQAAPQCAWCGSPSKTVCGRCKVRAYCSNECQRLDWKSGHQTACSPSLPKPAPTEEETFTFYHVPYVAHWAINLSAWNLKQGSREYDFLLSKVTEQAAIRRITKQKTWHGFKVALAKELAVCRMAEVLTQGIWQKTHWKHDRQTDREYLVDRNEYIWTGQRYVNSNVRFPNFNFSTVECGDYLFIVSHPAGLTGIYAAAPLQTVSTMPDPREAFAEQWAEAKEAAADDASEQSDSVIIEDISSEVAARPANNIAEIGTLQKCTVEKLGDDADQVWEEATTQDAGEDAAAWWADNSNWWESTASPEEWWGDGSDWWQEACGEEWQSWQNAEADAEWQETRQVAEDKWQVTDEEEDATEQPDNQEDKHMLGQEEVLNICEPQDVEERRWRLRQAMAAKMAYYRTIGQRRARQWSQVRLEAQPVSLDEVEETEIVFSQRHHLYIDGQRQNRWRCEVHDFRGYCLIVCRAPPEESEDSTGDFRETQAARHLEVDQYDKVLEHAEPPFVQVPIKELLPPAWHSDYVRACGGGERGDTLRMNR